MKQRNLWRMFLLELVTLGIYRLYFLVKTRNEMVARDPNVKIKSVWFLIAPWIVMFVAIIALIPITIASSGSKHCISNTTTFEPQTSQVDSSGSTTTDSSGFSTTATTSNGTTTETCTTSKSGALAGAGALFVMMAAMIIGFIFYIIWLWGYCHGIEVTTGGQLSFAIALVIIILVPDGIDILIVQEYFNKVGASTAPPTSAVPPAAPTATPPIAPTPPSSPTPPTPTAPVASV